ncbi:MAG: hypothetical protein GSR84_04485 [Desulfurococcales archaeon]|nr:hypothetical protein [Desulfurococcales archaeon]
MVWDYLSRAVKIAKKSTVDFKNAAKKQFGENSEVGERLGEAAPYLCGKIDEMSLAEYELYATIEWLERPEGPPPSASFESYRLMLSDCRHVLDDSILDAMAGSEDDLL